VNRSGRTGSTQALALAGAAVAAALYARRGYLRYGATHEELTAGLAGDELLPGANIAATRAITIDAPAERVWPWLVQLGQGRGGFYSYDFLENLVGCDMHSADRIVPEWQSIEIGDEVRLHPEVGLVVAAVQPGRALVLRGGIPMGNVPPPYDFTWAFVLLDGPGGAARLVVRFGESETAPGLHDDLRAGRRRGRSTGRVRAAARRRETASSSDGRSVGASCSASRSARPGAPSSRSMRLRISASASGMRGA
jgi:hypothetical protein